MGDGNAWASNENEESESLAEQMQWGMEMLG